MIVAPAAPPVAAPRVRMSGRTWERVLIGLALLVVGGVVVLPIATVFVQAFAGGIGVLGTLFGDEYARSAIALTTVAAVWTIVFNTAFGILAAWTITKYRFPGKALLVTLIDLPLSVSPIIVGLAALLFLGPRTPFGGFLADHGLKVAFAVPGIVFVTILVTIPYVARELIAYLQDRGRELEEAALVLGASPWQTLWRVTLPDAKWALAGGVLLCNARALGEFGAVTVISGKIRGLTDTVPLHIENLYNEGSLVAAFALAALLATATILLSLLRSFVESRRESHGARAKL